MAGKLKLKQVRSSNGSSHRQKDSLRTLGLGRVGKSSERPDDPAVRGLSVDKVLGLGGGNDAPAEEPIEEAVEA